MAGRDRKGGKAVNTYLIWRKHADADMVECVVLADSPEEVAEITGGEFIPEEDPNEREAWGTEEVCEGYLRLRKELFHPAPDYFTHPDEANMTLYERGPLKVAFDTEGPKEGVDLHIFKVPWMGSARITQETTPVSD